MKNGPESLHQKTNIKNHKIHEEDLRNIEKSIASVPKDTCFAMFSVLKLLTPPTPPPKKEGNQQAVAGSFVHQPLALDCVGEPGCLVLFFVSTYQGVWVG